MTALGRRRFLELGAAAVSIAACDGLASRRAEAPKTATPTSSVPPFELDELGVAALRKGLDEGRFTAVSLVERYLERIRALDREGPALRAILETNPDALPIARALDAERKAKGPRGPLHGIPVVVKDNIDTADRMQTTAGSLALEHVRRERDAFVVARLRAAGAVVLAKTNLSEWANFRSSHSTSGWSARGGQCRNPYVLDRNPSGSSSGTAAAIAANLAALGVGTETDGSIVSPASCCGLVGVKPTVGLVSRAGIIPIAHSQDTAGPMTRTVADAAVLLSVLAGEDPADPATAASRGRPAVDYARALDPRALAGAKIGVLRKFAGTHPDVDKLFDGALDTMKKLGATIVDPADLPTHGQLDDPELVVLLYEFKADLDAYLARLGPSAPVKSLRELVAFNDAHADREMPYFGQDLFIKAAEKGPLTTDEYRAALEKCQRLSRAEGIDGAIAKYKVDVLVAPTGSPAWTTDVVNGDHIVGGSSTPAAVAGYPSVTVPMGFVRALPVSLSFIGKPFDEALLLKLAYAFEQATRARKPPRFVQTIGS